MRAATPQRLEALGPVAAAARPQGRAVSSLRSTVLAHRAYGAIGSLGLDTLGRWRSAATPHALQGVGPVAAAKPPSGAAWPKVVPR